MPTIVVLDRCPYYIEYEDINFVGYKDKHRIVILEQLSSAAITNSPACTLLRMGTRQLRCIRKEFASMSASNIIHSNKNRNPNT